MGKVVCILGLLATGCAGQVRPMDPTCQNNYSEIRDEVYEEWLEVGVDTPTCYSLEFLHGDAFKEACQGHDADGCSFRRSRRIYVRSDLELERQMVVIKHEVGHLASVNPGHLFCIEEPGDDVMCETGAYNGTSPTLRDAAFVKGLLSESETE